MPRRNNREQYTPLDLSPETKPRALRVGSPPPSYVNQRAQERREAEQRRHERQRNARMRHGIDWTVCIVPGCGADLMMFLTEVPLEKRNPNETLPLCTDHSVMIWAQVQRNRWLPEVVETAEQLHARHVAEAEATRRKADQQFKERQDGEIYFVRINALVKVGWTRTLPRRLKEYGAGAELLCHYPGTSDDETTLHRQLRSVLAKGREWYHDGDVIQLYVKQAIERHGLPTAEAEWTEPTKEVIKLRRR